MSEQSTVGPLSHKRHNQDLYSDPVPGLSKHPVETDATAADNEIKNQKKKKKSNSDEVELAIDSAKSKVNFLM
jgi:hypothetical protein